VVNKTGVGSAKCDGVGCKAKRTGDEKGWKYIQEKGLFCPKCTKKRGYDSKRPGLHKIKRKSKLDKWK